MELNDIRPPLWSGVYAPLGQRGRRVDVVEEDGARLLIVAPGLAPTWVERWTVVPDMVFTMRMRRETQR